MNIKLRQNLPISREELSKARNLLKNRLEELKQAFSSGVFESPDSFLGFLGDGKLDSVYKFLEKKKHLGLPKVIFVVGIGGANLAAKAVYDATSGFAEGIHDSDRKMIFLDTIDPSLSDAVELYINSLTENDSFFVVIVSKSGKTIETLANSEFLLNRLEQKFGDIRNRIVVVSREGSPLWNEANEKAIEHVSIPDSLSDRFSAFSPNSLVPLGLFGFPIKDFISSAKKNAQELLSQESISLETAVVLDILSTQGYEVYDLFFFSSRLETLGKWQKQLIAESLGKNKDLNGQDFTKTLLPIVSMGTTDLHSELQRTMTNRPKTVTSFISIDSGKGDSLGNATTIDLLNKNITELDEGELSDTILTSVQESYTKNNLPFFDIRLKDFDLAEYMIFAMLQVVYLGALWNVNVYDQPNVEDYKERVRMSLE